MEIIQIQENAELGFVFLDKNFKVVELTTNYIRAIHSRGMKYSLNSIKHYAKVLLYFCEFLEGKYRDLSIDVLLASLNSLIVSDYLKLLKSEGKSAATIRNREAVIREFLTWLTTEEAGYARSNNAYASGRYLSPKPNRKVPKYLTVQEIIQFIQLLHDESQRCLVHFLFDSGLRISEVLRLKKSDIPSLHDYSDDTVYFDINVRGSKGRGGSIKERKTFVTRALIQRINRLHKQHKVYKKAWRSYRDEMPCFLNVKGKPLTENAIKNLLFKVAIRGNLSPSKYTSHKFRHSFAVSILISEFDTEFINKLVIAKEALGHNHIKTTEIYTHIPPAAIKNLQKLNEQYDIYNRFEESQLIFDKTYLPQKKHTEMRGRTWKK